MTASLVILLRLAGLFQAGEWSSYDLFMRFRPQEPRDSRIVIVEIEGKYLNALHHVILPDQIYAQLLQKLNAQKPWAIGLGIHRNLPVDPGQETLKALLKDTPNLIGVETVAGVGRGAVPPSPILKEKGRVGADDILIDADHTVRRGKLTVTLADGEPFPTLSWSLAQLYLAHKDIYPEIDQSTGDWILGKARFSALQTYDGYRHERTEIEGHQFLINYRGPNRTFDTVSISEVLENKLIQDWGRDRVILIGGKGHNVFTPYNSGLLVTEEPPMTAIELQANLTSQIISAALEGRPSIHVWAEPLEWLWITGWSGLGALLVWRFRSRGAQHQQWLAPVGGAILMVSLLLISSYLAFLGGWFLPLIPAFVAWGGSATVLTIYLAHSAGEIRRTFGRYLSHDIVATLLEHPGGLELGGERRTLTMLTSDLRGFTATAERLSPESVLKVLNFYLSAMADVITHYQGTIDEFMGDGILVLFGAPMHQDDGAQRAVACAVAMQLAMTKVNQAMSAWQLPPLEMGIGIHTGEAIVGNIGSEKRTKYGIVGNQVNLTYRIESYTTGGQILISESTLAEIESVVQVQGHHEVKPKGVKAPIQIYDVSGIRGDYNLFLSQCQDIFVPLLEAIPLQFSLLADKHIEHTRYAGQLMQLSAKGALVQLQAGESVQMQPLTNLKLNLSSPDSPLEHRQDIYAKVLDQPAEPNHFYLTFTSVPLEISIYLDALYQKLLDQQPSGLCRQ